MIWRVEGELLLLGILALTILINEQVTSIKGYLTKISVFCINDWVLLEQNIENMSGLMSNLPLVLYPVKSVVWLFGVKHDSSEEYSFELY